MEAKGSLGLGGALSLKVIRAVPRRELSLFEIIQFGLPAWGLDAEVNAWRWRNLPNLWRGAWKVIAARAQGIPIHYGMLSLIKIRADGTRVAYGLASMRVITTAGVNYVAACFDNTNEPELFKYHGFGTGTGAEAVGDTALGTEFTTEYAVDSTRPTGSQAHSTNTYTTVATFSPDSGGTLAVTEHGIFTATTAGTLLDRTKFSAVNLVASADSLQATYVLTLASGG